MKFSAALDVHVVAHEQTDEVVVMLDLAAPTAVVSATRPPSTLQVVLDRSGSMSGAPLAGAKQALVALLARLEPTDHFGLVVFDDGAQVVVPTGPLGDKSRVADQIASVQSGGMTDLSTGYLRALQELKRVEAPSATLLVISDGHVNTGVSDPDTFGTLAHRAHGTGVVTSTLGYGEGYDETLLAAIARAGSGNHVFAADPDAAGAAIGAEVDGLLDKVVQAATLTVSFEPTVQMLQLYNDLPAHQLGDGEVQVELGDLYAEEERTLLLRLGIPALAALGLAQVATLELRYVELPGLVEHVVRLPISVNVVPGDQAAGRVPDQTVRSEVMFQEAQAAKRRASEAFERGDLDAGRAELGASRTLIGGALPMAAPAMAASFRAELDDVDAMTTMAAPGAAAGSSYLSKVTRESYHRQNRKRGR